MLEPLVSIIVPTHNRAQFLRKAIGCILGQTYRNLEVIIVNDGSTDNTREVIDELLASDGRLRAVHKPNGGIANALNNGFARATGRYVTWNSDDNYYHANAIELMVNYLEAHPDVDFVYTDAREVDGEGDFLQYYRGGEPERLRRLCNIRGCLLYRREVNQIVGPYNPKWPRVQDYDFYRRAFDHVRMGYIAEAPYDYTVHVASMSGDERAILRETGEFLAGYAKTRGDRRRAWAWCFTEIAKAERDRLDKRWLAVWHRIRAGWYDRSLLGAAWHELWTTTYNLLPGRVKKTWRSIKHSIRCQG
jgi:glycosyltransferase involved in cell wall biosynthesis